MSFVYLASPYSHPDESVRRLRFARACEKAAALMAQGYTVFAPIAHSHPVAKYLPEELLLHHRFWMKQDLPILVKAEKLIVLALCGWRESRGVEEEIMEAVRWGISIEYHDMDGLIFPDEGIANAASHDSQP